MSNYNTIETNKAIAEGYAQYVAEVTFNALMMGAEVKPIPLSQFQHKPCVLCDKIIVDDPFGHSPSPLRKTGVCCSQCNKTKVLPARVARLQAQRR
jgi:hypothetical protein